jgi:hypothetical protein
VDKRKLQQYENFCGKVLACDKSIRFAGIADKQSKVIATEYRRGTVPLLSKDESVLSFVLSIVKIRSDKTFHDKLGNILCTISLYEKVTVATMPLGISHFLMVSFDKDADHQSILSKNIQPLKAEFEKAM